MQTTNSQSYQPAAWGKILFIGVAGFAAFILYGFLFGGLELTFLNLNSPVLTSGLNIVGMIVCVAVIFGSIRSAITKTELTLSAESLKFSDFGKTQEYKWREFEEVKLIPAKSGTKVNGTLEFYKLNDPIKKPVVAVDLVMYSKREEILAGVALQLQSHGIKRDF